MKFEKTYRYNYLTGIPALAAVVAVAPEDVAWSDAAALSETFC
jgi:hypothetical protein